MTTSTTASDWTPPGRNCGACGSRTCADFEALLRSGSASPEKCPFYNVNTLPVRGYTEVLLYRTMLYNRNLDLYRH